MNNSSSLSASLLTLLATPMPIKGEAHGEWRDGLNLVFAGVICLNAAEGQEGIGAFLPTIHQCHAELVMLAEAMEAAAGGEDLNGKVSVKTANGLAITHGDVLRRLVPILEHCAELFETLEPDILSQAVASALQREELQEIAQTLLDVPQDAIIFALYDMVDALKQHRLIDAL